MMHHGILYGKSSSLFKSFLICERCHISWEAYHSLLLVVFTLDSQYDDSLQILRACCSPNPRNFRCLFRSFGSVHSSCHLLHRQKSAVVSASKLGNFQSSLGPPHPKSFASSRSNIESLLISWNGQFYGLPGIEMALLPSRSYPHRWQL